MKTAILITAALAASTAHAEPAGLQHLVFDAPHHRKEVTGAVFYPSSEDGYLMTYAENPVFTGVSIAKGATPRDGNFPIVLLSHGMGGNVRSLAWLATDLAERGAIVVSVNHPNTTWGDFDLSAGMDHWTRAQDLSAALDAVMTDPQFAGHIDQSRIMAAGFSYGGWTALSLGGALGNLQGYVDHCADDADANNHCDDLERRGVDLAGKPAAQWNASFAEPRVTHVTAIDPGLIWGLSAGEVDALIDNVTIIGLGEGETRMTATDFDSSGFAALLPEAKIDRIVPAVHFTAMPLCKPEGAEILKAEQDDPVCTDPDGTDRAGVHARIVNSIASDLGL